MRQSLEQTKTGLAFRAPKLKREFPRAVAIGAVLEDLPMEVNRIDLDSQCSGLSRA